jgi:hypothetical protein
MHCDLMEAREQLATARCDLLRARTHHVVDVDSQGQWATTGENINLYHSELFGVEFGNQPSFVARYSWCRRHLWPSKLLPPTRRRRRRW